MSAETMSAEAKSIVFLSEALMKSLSVQAEQAKSVNDLTAEIVRLNKILDEDSESDCSDCEQHGDECDSDCDSDCEYLIPSAEIVHEDDSDYESE